MKNNITFEHLLDTLCDEMLNSAGAEGCAVALIDENSKKIRGVSGGGIFSSEKVRQSLNNNKDRKTPIVIDIVNKGFSKNRQEEESEITEIINYPFGQGIRIDNVESLAASNRIRLIKDVYVFDTKINNLVAFPIKSFSNNQPVGMLILNNTNGDSTTQNVFNLQHLKMLFSTIEYYVNYMQVGSIDTFAELKYDFRYNSLVKNRLLLSSVKSQRRLNNIEFPFWIAFSIITFISGLLYANYLFDIEIFQIGKSTSGKLLIILFGFLVEFILGILWLENFVKNKIRRNGTK